MKPLRLRKTGYAGHSSFTPYLLNVVTNRLNAGFQSELIRRRMTLTHWRVLALLSEQDGLPVTVLAERIATDQSTMSRALLRLEQQHLVARRTGARDSRVVQTFLTAKGKQQFEEILPIALGFAESALRGIDAAELASLHRTLGRILENLN